MVASIFDSALSHTRRSDASEKQEENSVSTFGRFRLWTSFESSLVSVKQPMYIFLFLNESENIAETYELHIAGKMFNIISLS